MFPPLSKHFKAVVSFSLTFFKPASNLPLLSLSGTGFPDLHLCVSVVSDNVCISVVSQRGFQGGRPSYGRRQRVPLQGGAGLTGL